MPRKNEPTERCCIVTRETRPVGELIRFVAAPDGSVVADLRRRLPGRGVWVTARRDMVEQAERKRLFGRGFKADISLEPGLADRADAMLQDAALSSLSMTKKAGCIVAGFAKVEAAIAKGEVAAIVEAADAGGDGVRKIAAALRRRLDGGQEIPVIRIFTSDQLSLALGRSNVIHAALLEDRASSAFIERVEALIGFRDGFSGPDDKDGSPETASRD